MNTNMLHNVINILIIVISAMGAMDWTEFVDPETAAGIVGALSALKLVMNMLRDGFTGLVKVQPPVEK